MLLLLAVWVLLSIVLGVVIGAGIHQADAAQRRARPPAADDDARTPAAEDLPKAPAWRPHVSIQTP